MKAWNLILKTLFVFSFLSFSAQAHTQRQASGPVIQLVRTLPVGQGESVYFSASAPGQPIYNMYCENCCGFVAYPWEEPSYKAGTQFQVENVKRFRSGLGITPYTYDIVWRFKGGRLQCAGNHPPDAAYANHIMRGYIRISQ
jgi:hypothetical protein